MLEESEEEVRELIEGESGVVGECEVAVCGVRCSSVARTSEAEDFSVMLFLHSGQVCLSFSQGSTQFL